MRIVDVQNVIARSFEVQSLAQQAAWHAQLSQQAQAIRMLGEQQRRHTQIEQLSKSAASNATEEFDPDRQQRGGQHSPHRGHVPASPPEPRPGQNPGPRSRVDLLA